MTLHLRTDDQSKLRRAYVGLVIEVFRLNGNQLAIGDVLGADLGLTSSRWQVLGAMSLSPAPLPVASIARNMGLSRQTVQYSVDEMRVEGLVRLEPNPHHRRAMLVVMTEKGETAYQTASKRHGCWAEALFADLRPDRIEAASELLRELQNRIANSMASLTAIKTEEKQNAEIRRNG